MRRKAAALRDFSPVYVPLRVNRVEGGQRRNVNYVRCTPNTGRKFYALLSNRSASCRAIGIVCFTRNLQISLHLSGTFQVSIFARVGHDQRCSEPDGNDARDVPSEPLLLT